MLSKNAIKCMKNSKIIYSMIILLLVAAFFVGTSMTSAIYEKVKRYTLLASYLNQDGFVLSAVYLQSPNQILFRDYMELKEWYPEINDVICMEYLWETEVREKNQAVDVWCYSEDLVGVMQPDMMDGRWFLSDDNDSNVLKAVVTYNEGEYKVGDVITIESTLTNAQVRVEIIGVMSDDVDLYYNDGFTAVNKDYRDCFYTYDYTAEGGRAILILSDSQILAGQSRGVFGELNYRLAVDEGIQKEISGTILLTFDDNVSSDITDSCIAELKKNSEITHIYNLSDFKENSLDYVFSELKIYIPLFACVVVFLFIISVSANVVTTKKQLRNYAIYYICGLTWKRCCNIGALISVYTSLVSLVLVVISAGVVSIVKSGSYGIFGTWQIATISVIIAAHNFTGLIISYELVKRESAINIINSRQ